MNNREIICEEYPDIVFCDGYDDCIIGIVEKYGSEPCVCYDLNKMIAKMVSDGMTEYEAYEHFNFNILGSYVGKDTPCFMSFKLADQPTRPISRVIVK